MEKIEGADGSSMAICSYNGAYKKHFTAVVYKDGQYSLLDSFQNESSALSKEEVKAHFMNSLSQSTKFVILVQQ